MLVPLFTLTLLYAAHAQFVDFNNNKKAVQGIQDCLALLKTSGTYYQVDNGTRCRKIQVLGEDSITYRRIERDVVDGKTVGIRIRLATAMDICEGERVDVPGLVVVRLPLHDLTCNMSDPVRWL